MAQHVERGKSLSVDSRLIEQLPDVSCVRLVHRADGRLCRCHIRKHSVAVSSDAVLSFGVQHLGVRCEAFIEPEMPPACTRDEIAKPLMTQLVRENVFSIGITNERCHGLMFHGAPASELSVPELFVDEWIQAEPIRKNLKHINHLRHAVTGVGKILRQHVVDDGHRIG